MAYVPANRTLQVELRGVSFGKEVENTLYFQRADSIDTAEVDALFDFLEDDWITELLPYYPTTFEVDELYATDLTTSSSPTYSRGLSPALVGTNVSAGMPNNVAACVSFRTAGRGRSSRGRNYVGGLVESGVSGDLIGLSTINGLVAIYELLLGGGTFPGGWEWVVVSRFLDNLPRVAALVQPILDVLSTDLRVDSQRKRVR